MHYVLFRHAELNAIRSGGTLIRKYSAHIHFLLAKAITAFFLLQQSKIPTQCTHRNITVFYSSHPAFALELAAKPLRKGSLNHFCFQNQTVSP